MYNTLNKILQQSGYSFNNRVRNTVGFRIVFQLVRWGGVFMKDPRKLQDILQMHALNNKVQRVIQSKLVDTGLISRNEFVDAFRGNILVEQQNPAVLAAVYTTMYETFPE